MTTPSETNNVCKSNHDDTKYVQFVLIGDSDMSRWPAHLWPIIRISSPSPSPSSSSSPLTSSSGTGGVRKPPPPVLNVSKYGSFFGDVPQQIQTANDRLKARSSPSGAASSYARTKEDTPTIDSDDTTVVFLLCAGENDISSGARTEEVLERIADSLQRTVHRIFHDHDYDATAAQPGPQPNGAVTARRQRHLVLLGPKLEPWLVDDAASRGCYVSLDRALRSACRRLDGALGGGSGAGCDGGEGVGRYIAYVDCLTAFCEREGYGNGVEEGDPDGKYFEGDGLHLGMRGYGIWKGLVEETVEAMLRVE